MNFILAAYEHLRQRGQYDVDWVDRLGWRSLAVLVLCLVLF